MMFLGFARSRALLRSTPLSALRQNSVPRTGSLQAQFHCDFESPGGPDLRDFLGKLRHNVWGYVVYRTTYQDEPAWQSFKSIFTEQLTDMAKETFTPEVINTLTFTFMDDRAKFDGISRPTLRRHFNDWAATAVAAENPESTSNGLRLEANPRYCKFLQVDQEVLESHNKGWILSRLDRKVLPGHINLVDAHWPIISTRVSMRHLTNEATPEDDDEGYEDIDGCKDEWVGWMKIHPCSLSVEQYLVFGGEWDGIYRRPPEVVDY